MLALLPLPPLLLLLLLLLLALPLRVVTEQAAPPVRCLP